MRGRLQSAFAVVAGVLLVATAALGGAMMQPGVDSVDDAAGQYVERGEGQVALGAGIVIGAAAYYTYENYIKNNPDTSALQKADANETEKEIYDQASIQEQNNELTHTAYGNYLQDTESIALMEGKNAYIRALENGSAESVARNKAIEAVSSYYAVKQQNVIAAWNTTAIVANSSAYTARNTTGVSEAFVYGANGTTKITYGADNYPFAVEGTNSQSVPLTNGTSVSAEALHVGSTGGTYDWNFTVNSGGKNPSNYPDVQGLAVEAPNSNYDDLALVDFNEFKSKWSAIEQQNSDVQSQMDTFVNNTYSSYQQGEINTSDLIDPYLGAREYSPETSDTWTLRTLSAMGLDSPQNLSSIGVMNVSADGTTYSGVLMSDGTPTDGYVVGGTYNAANITGAQFVATLDGDAVELEGNFTLESAEGYADGETVAYSNISYQTADTEEFKALQEQLDQLTAAINARQQEQRNAGGGGFLPDFGQGGAIPGALLLAGAAAFLLTRD